MILSWNIRQCYFQSQWFLNANFGWKKILLIGEEFCCAVKCHFCNIFVTSYPYFSFSRRIESVRTILRKLNTFLYLERPFLGLYRIWESRFFPRCWPWWSQSIIIYNRYAGKQLWGEQWRWIQFLSRKILFWQRGSLFKS